MVLRQRLHYFASRHRSDCQVRRHQPWTRSDLLPVSVKVKTGKPTHSLGSLLTGNGGGVTVVLTVVGNVALHKVAFDGWRSFPSPKKRTEEKVVPTDSWSLALLDSHTHCSLCGRPWHRRMAARTRARGWQQRAKSSKWPGLGLS